MKDLKAATCTLQVKPCSALYGVPSEVNYYKCNETSKQLKNYILIIMKIMNIHIIHVTCSLLLCTYIDIPFCGDTTTMYDHHGNSGR